MFADSDESESQTETYSAEALATFLTGVYGHYAAAEAKRRAEGRNGKQDIDTRKLWAAVYVLLERAAKQSKR